MKTGQKTALEASGARKSTVNLKSTLPAWPQEQRHLGLTSPHSGDPCHGDPEAWGHLGPALRASPTLELLCPVRPVRGTNLHGEQDQPQAC